MYLSKLLLNPRDRAVRFDLANCHELHRTLLSVFDGDRAETELLYRIEPATQPPVVIAQTAVSPNWERLRRRAPGYLVGRDGDGWQVKSLDAAHAAVRQGDILRFRLRANPTKRISKASVQTQSAMVGKRVALLKEEQRLAWLRHKAQLCGFRLRTVGSADVDVPAVDIRPEGTVLGRRATAERTNRERLTFGSVLFEGELEVTDAEAFRSALRDGIGSGKAYGFGLLSVARVPR